MLISLNTCCMAGTEVWSEPAPEPEAVEGVLGQGWARLVPLIGKERLDSHWGGAGGVVDKVRAYIYCIYWISTKRQCNSRTPLFDVWLLTPFKPHPSLAPSAHTWARFSLCNSNSPSAFCQRPCLRATFSAPSRPPRSQGDTHHSRQRVTQQVRLYLCNIFTNILLL